MPPAAPDARALARARDRIAGVCAAPPSGTDLLREVSRRLAAVVPFDAAGWLTTDPATGLFTGAVVEEIPASAHMRFYENELLEEDRLKFASLRAGGRPVGRLSDATGGDPGRSARHRALYRPFGLRHEMRAAFVVDGACWGVACLARAEGEPDFAPAEVRFVESLCPLVGAGLRAAAAAARGEAPGADGPGVVVLRAGGSVESMTAEAARWLEAIPRDRLHEGGLELPSAVYAVAAAALAPGAGGARARVATEGGRWLTLRGSALATGGGDPGRVAVTVEPARPAEVAPLVVGAHELSDREAQVVALLAQGLATDEIAARLVISRHTLRDHVKSVFAKLGVASRPELTARLFVDHYLPGLATPPAGDDAAG